MKKRLILFALALLVAVPGMAKSQIVRDSLQSVVLGRAVKYNVYLPDGFDRSDKAYPVVYLLHGLYGNNEDWEQRGQMKTVLDELIGTGEAVEMVVIMPCAGDGDVRHVQNGYFKRRRQHRLCAASPEPLLQLLRDERLAGPAGTQSRRPDGQTPHCQ